MDIKERFYANLAIIREQMAGVDMQEAEQLDEISPETLRRYIDKAPDSVRTMAAKTVVGASAADAKAFYKKNDAKVNRRMKYFKKALRKYDSKK